MALSALTGIESSSSSAEKPSGSPTQTAVVTYSSTYAGWKGLFGGGKPGGKGTWTCTASLVFDGDRLTRVSFAHKDVDSPYAWQKIKDVEKQEEKREAGVPTCTFSLPNCPH